MLRWTPTGIAYNVVGHVPAVLLLHAGIADHRTWDDVADLLVATHTVVRPDFRGFGASATSGTCPTGRSGTSTTSATCSTRPGDNRDRGRQLGATLVELAEAAHLLPLEEPARVAALIV